MIKENKEYWEEEYYSPNVETTIFRSYGVIIRDQLKIEKKTHILDFGCGQGATMTYLEKEGHIPHGIDISKSSIRTAQKKLPKYKENIKLIKEKYNSDKLKHNNKFTLITAMQSIIYQEDKETKETIEQLRKSLKRGGIILATIPMGKTRNGFYKNSERYKGGLRRVHLKNNRTEQKTVIMRFTKNEKELEQLFKGFKKIHIGYYDQKYREDEPNTIYYIYIGVKK